MVGKNHLVGPEPKDAAIDRGEPLQRVILEVRADRRVDLVEMSGDSVDEFLGELAHDRFRIAQFPEGGEAIGRHFDGALRLIPVEELYGGFASVTARRRRFLFGLEIPGGGGIHQNGGRLRDHREGRRSGIRFLADFG